VKEEAGIPLEIVKRSDMVKGFHVLPKRWIVERLTMPCICCSMANACHPASSAKRVIAVPTKDQTAIFAKAITHHEFGRFYWDGQRESEVRRSLANAMARVKEERRARAKLLAKAKK
jgi:hypothetical protein